MEKNGKGFYDIEHTLDISNEDNVKRYST